MLREQPRVAALANVRSRDKRTSSRHRKSVARDPARPRQRVLLQRTAIYRYWKNKTDGTQRSSTQNRLVAVARDCPFIPFDADTWDVGDFNRAAVDRKRFFQDGIGPVLPFQPMSGLRYAH